MSEHEEQPVMRLNIGKRRFEATPENTSIFTFIGELALYNHVFMQTGTKRGQEVGTYIFERIAPEPFTEMRDYMFQAGYPMHVNLRQVAECDKNAYECHVKAITADLEAGIPDEWAA